MTERKKKKRKVVSGRKRSSTHRKYEVGGKTQRRRNFIKIIRFLMILTILTLVVVSILRMKDLPMIKKAMIERVDRRKTDLNDVIAETCKSIGITEENYLVINRSNEIYIKIGINHNEMDLLLANSIISGKISTAGGEIIEARESANSRYQDLVIREENNSRPYKVRLYYGDYDIKRKEIYLIVDDFGSYISGLLDDFCNLDPAITFAIIPNEPYYQEIMHKADSTGHDIIVHLPMEPIDIRNNDPGEKAILVEYSPARIKEYTREFLKRIPLAVGANNHMGSLATSMDRVMKPVLQVLREHEMFFIDSFTTANSVVLDTASREQVLSARRDLFLDNFDLEDSTLINKMEKLHKIAKDKDQIIVISHCHNREKYDFLKKFINRAKAADYRFVRISNLFSSGREVF